MYYIKMSEIEINQKLNLDVFQGDIIPSETDSKKNPVSKYETRPYTAMARVSFIP